MNNQLIPIAHIETDFPTKFGVPRQSGLVKGLKGRIVFEPEFRDPEALRGLEGFSHIWLLWDFGEARKKTLSNSPLKGEGQGSSAVPPAPDRREEGKTNNSLPFKGRFGGVSPTVRPPRLGGNRRMGVFATRSPFRPNHIGLSSVRILSISLHSPDGPLIEVEGIDMVDGTAIFDIKPYLAFTDSHPDAVSGFASTPADFLLEVIFPKDLLDKVPADHRKSLIEVLAHDPRPQYQDDPGRVYGMAFGGMEVKFKVEGIQLTVVEVLP